MKLQGEYVVRQVADNIVVIPIGETALQMNGMILLNDVSKVIWEALAQETTIDEILTAVTDAFEVSQDQAREDILEFIEKLRNLQMLEE